ncbi:uncharacterized protein [Aristolochia californica]|uniref:uncharacterized protein n=1 Tax=Aristolochia californica TaxID=171875 RepID=UPI0035E09CC1
MMLELLPQVEQKMGFPTLESSLFRWETATKVEAQNTKVKKTTIPVAELVHGAMQPRDVQKAVEKEGEMALQDRVTDATNEKKNAVAAYVYDMRHKLHDKYHDLVTASAKEAVSAHRQHVEDWLYAYGEDENKGVYVAKLVEMAKQLVMSPITVSCVPPMCAPPIDFFLGRLLHNYTIPHGFQSRVFVSNGLVNINAKWVGKARREEEAAGFAALGSFPQFFCAAAVALQKPMLPAVPLLQPVLIIQKVVAAVMYGAQLSVVMAPTGIATKIMSVFTACTISGALEPKIMLLSHIAAATKVQIRAPQQQRQPEKYNAVQYCVQRQNHGWVMELHKKLIASCTPAVDSGLQIAVVVALPQWGQQKKITLGRSDADEHHLEYVDKNGNESQSASIADATQGHAAVITVVQFGAHQWETTHLIGSYLGKQYDRVFGQRGSSTPLSSLHPAKALLTQLSVVAVQHTLLLASPAAILL